MGRLGGFERPRGEGRRVGEAQGLTGKQVVVDARRLEEFAPTLAAIHHLRPHDLLDGVCQVVRQGVPRPGHRQHRTPQLALVLTRFVAVFVAPQCLKQTSAGAEGGLVDGFVGEEALG